MVNTKQYFNRLHEPDVQDTIESIAVNVYFLDGYDFKKEALQQQLFFMQAKPKSISLLLEKEIYDLIPNYYSAQSLLIVHKYYTEIYKKKFVAAFTGGFAVSIIVGVLIEVFELQFAFSGLYGVAIGTMTMLLILTLSVRRQQRVARDTMRERLIALHGENRLNAYLERQEKYMQERRTILDSTSE
jgi:hypothetical protein